MAQLGNLGVQIPNVPNINPSVMANAFGNVTQAQNAYQTASQRAPVQQGFVNQRAGIDYNDLQGNYNLRNRYLGQTYGNQANQLAGQYSYNTDLNNAQYGYNTGRTNAQADFDIGAYGRNWGDLQYSLGRNLGVTQAGEAAQLAAANQSAAAREAAAQRDFANHTAMLDLQRKRDAETLYSSALARGFGNSGVNDVTGQRFRQDYANQGTELSNAQRAVMEAMAAQRAQNQASSDYALNRAQAGYDIGMRNGLTDYQLGIGRTNLGRDWDLRQYAMDQYFGNRQAANAYQWGINVLNTNTGYQMGLNQLGYNTGMANIGLAQQQGLTNIGWNLADYGTQAQMTATQAYLQMLASSGR